MTDTISVHCFQCNTLTDQRVTRTEPHHKFPSSQVVSESVCLTCGEDTRHYVEDTCLDSILPNGEIIDDLTSSDTFTITGRGTVYVVLPMWNRKALRGRTITIDGVARKVAGVESCLVLGHDEGYCNLSTGVLVND